MNVKRLPLVLAIVLLSLAMTTQGHAVMINTLAQNTNAQRMISRATARMNARRKRTPIRHVVTVPSHSSSSSSSVVSSSSSSSASTSIDAVRQKILDLVNAERSNAGLSPLTYNKKLEQSAQAHAEDMQNRNFFDHVNPDGKTPSDRIKATGYLDVTGCNCRWSYADGENIAMGQTTPEQVMKDWMNSPGHKANILSTNFTEMGVGYVTGSKPYWVQNFGRVTKN